MFDIMSRTRKRADAIHKIPLLRLLSVMAFLMSFIIWTPGETLAATVNLYPTAYTDGGTATTNPTNAYADDAASADVSPNNALFDLIGFDGTDLGTISDVTVWVDYKTSAVPSNDTYGFLVDVDGNWTTTGDQYAIVAQTLTDQPAYTTASYSLGALTWAQVGTLQFRCDTTKTGGADTYFVNFDVAYAVVTYTASSAGSLQFSSSSYSAGEGAGTATITATRTGGSTGAVGVSYSTSDGTAASGTDYNTASGTLNWADGDTADKTFNVTIIDDGDTEPDETVTLTLSGPSGGASLGSPSTASLTITDNDGGGGDPEVPAGGLIGAGLLAVGIAAYALWLKAVRE